MAGLGHLPGDDSVEQWLGAVRVGSFQQKPNVVPDEPCIQRLHASKLGYLHECSRQV